MELELSVCKNANATFYVHKRSTYPSLTTIIMMVFLTTLVIAQTLIWAKQISDLNEADGEQMYATENKQLPGDTKPPGRPWKHARSYKTKHTGVWHMKQRKCPDCSAIWRYISLNNIDECLIQYIGRHMWA